MAARRVLGIDLGGALQPTTGYALLSGARKPRLEDVGVLPRGKTAAAAESALVELIDRRRPTLVAVDSPLTLPPCLTCPSYCQGPSPDQCELEASRRIWDRTGNPLTERLCELELWKSVGVKPLPTMRIAQYAVRGVALARRLRALRAERGPVGGPELIEVYPAASLRRLGFGDRPPESSDEARKRRFRSRVLRGLGSKISGLDDDRECRDEGHAFDALIAAYTGWLAPEGLEAPPEDFNAASGWIWVPKPS
jgi:predicted nuclease with RNAse H fold